MASKDTGSAREKLSANIFHSNWMKVVTVMAGLTVFVTTYALVMPAITWSNQNAYCGYEEHVHLAECYDAEGNPICGLEEHTHTLACYSDPYADIENADVWNVEVPALTGDRNEDVLAVAQSLINYRESDSNYLVSEDNQTQGYSRFGHWYGDLVDGILQQSYDEVANEITVELQADPAASDRMLDADTVKTLYADAISARMAGKLAEKMVGVSPSELIEGHVERLANGLPSYSYRDWNAMFASYVLNYAQITDMGFESDAGNWAGTLASIGRYIDDPSYIPHVGDLIFFTPYIGSDLKVGIVSNVNRSFFGFGRSIKSISVILGDSDNSVEEIKVAMDEYQEGDVVFEMIHGYGDITPGDEEQVPDDASRADSIVDFITGLISPAAPSDEAVTEEASEEAADVQEEIVEEAVPADESAALETSENVPPADESVTNEANQPDANAVPADESTADAAKDAAGQKADGQPDANAVPADESTADAAKDAAGQKADGQPDGNAVPADESTADAAAKDIATDKSVDSKRPDEKKNDDKQVGADVVPADESTADTAKDVADQKVDDKKTDESLPVENIADDTKHIIGATEDDLDVIEDNEEAGTVVEIVQAGLNNEGTEINFNWQVTAQLSEDVLPAGAVIRVDTATGKAHAMTVTQAKEWIGNARVGGQSVSFVEDDTYEVTFVGTNGHLYTWEDVQNLKEQALVEFSGVHVKVLDDVVFEDGNCFVAFGYATSARLAEANIGQNYYVTKASVNGYTGTGSYTYENGQAIPVDQDRILQDANLDETGHAADAGSAANKDEEKDSEDKKAEDSISANVPQEVKTLTGEGNDYTVTMSYGPDAGIPDVAKLKVSEIRKGTPEYESYLADAKAALGMGEEDSIELLGRFFDIRIITKKGEFEPEAPVTVNIEYREAMDTEDAALVSAVHFDDEGASRIAASASESDGEVKTVEFEAESFSVYGIVYTVDYSYDGYTYYLAENKEISLEKVVGKLGITKAEEYSSSDDETGDREADAEAGRKYTYREFLRNISDVSASKDTVTLTKNNDWMISTAEDFAGSVITITLEDETKYRIHLVKAGENDLLNAMAGGYAITIDLGDSLPEGNYRIDAVQTTATAKEIAAIEGALYKKLPNGVSMTAVVSNASMLDISIIDVDKDEEIEPTGEVTVTIEKEGETLPSVVHIKNDGSTELLETEENTFVTDSFSTFTGNYTVDFHYSGLDFSMVGEGALLLGDLFKVLEIETPVSDVENVTFTDSSLVDIVPVKTDTTLGEILESYYEEYYAAILNEIESVDAVGEDIDFSAEDFDMASLAGELWEKQVKAGEWVLVSLKPFTTNETLTISLANGSMINIDVTDAVNDPFFGWYAIETNGENIEASVSKSVTNKEQERDASFTVNVSFDIKQQSLQSLKNSFGFPTLTYDLRDLVNDSPLKNITNTRPATWYAGSTPIGSYWIQDNVVYLQVTNLSWLRRQTQFGGDFSFRVSTDENELGTNDSYDYQFPGTGSSIHIDYKPLSWSSGKSSNLGSGEMGEKQIEAGPDGKYYVTYTATFNNPTKLQDLQFEDVVSAGQTILKDSVTVKLNGSDVRPPHIRSAIERSLSVTDGGTKLSFSASSNTDPRTGQKNAEIEKGTYTVSYKVEIDENYIKEAGSSGLSTMTNTATWKPNGEVKTGPDSTSFQPTKPATPPPPMVVDKNATNKTRSSGNWQPGDKIDYEVWYGGSGGSIFNGSTSYGNKDVRITDTMTNVQTLTGDVTMTFYTYNDQGQPTGESFSVIMPTAQNYNAYSGDGGVVWNPTNHQYSVSNTEVFNYNIPNTLAGHDLSNFRGRIEVTYSTEIISDDTALNANPPIYNLVTSTNKAEADGTQDYTTDKVKFPEEPEQTKTITTTNGQPVAAGSQLEPGKTYRYTLTYGSEGMPMKGVNIKDSMSALGDIVTSPITIVGRDRSITMPTAQNTYTEGQGYRWKIGSNAGTFQGYANEMKSVFDYTITEDITGPITITYDVTIADEATLKTLGFYGEGNMDNSFRVGGKTETTHNTVPGNKPITVSKSAAVKGSSGTTWQPGDEVTYTITYGDATTLMDGATLTDIMTNVQDLQGDIKIKIGNQAETNMPASSVVYNNNHTEGKYNTNTIEVFRHKINEGSGTYGPIVITYTTKIIDGATAARNGIYGLTGVANTAKTDKGGEDGTQGTVDYGPKPSIPYSKSVSPEDTTTTGVYNDETAGGWQPGQELTYTTTFGDANTDLNGVWMNDSMTQLQDLKGNLVITLREGTEDEKTITFNTQDGNGNRQNITVDGVVIGNYTNSWVYNHQEGNYNNNYAQVFDIRFNEKAGVGPVKVTYQTQVISTETATNKNIFGVRNVDNNFSTPEGNKSTHGTVPFEKEEYPTKTMKDVNTDVSVTSENGNKAVMNPVAKGDILDFTLTYGKDGQNMSGKNIYDTMTNLVDIVNQDASDSGITIKYKDANGSPQELRMPVGNDEWNGSGEVWHLKHTDGKYSNQTITVFNYNLPDGVYGPVTVEYKAKVLDLTEEELKQQNLTNDYNLTNTFRVDNKQAVTETTVPLRPASHKSTIDKTGYVMPDGTPAFKDESGNYPSEAVPAASNDDGTITWYIKVEAEEGSAYPLTNVEVSDKQGQYMINNWKLTGDLIAERWMNYKKAVVTGLDSGMVYTPGADYSAEQALTGSTRVVNGETRELGGPIIFKFPTVNEPIIIAITGQLPDSLIGTYQMSNRASVKDDGGGNGEAYAEINGENTDLVVTKKGTFDEENRVITWTVVLNPTKAKLDTVNDLVEFTDILPDGMVLVNFDDISDKSNPTIKVHYEGGQWGDKTFDVTTTGNTINALDIRNYQEMTWLNPPQKSYMGNMSGTSYEVKYKTWITDEEWDKITSSATGSEEYTNTAFFSDGGTNDYTATEDITIEAEDFINKYDISETFDEDGKEVLVADDVTYKIDVNPNKYLMNNGNTLSLYDTIPTNMDIRTGSYLESYMEGGEIKERRVPLIAVYKIDDESDTELDFSKLVSDVDISYNDDTRQLMFENLKDETHYVVVFKCRIRSLTSGGEEETFTNTATLVGGGSFSDTVSEQHTAYNHSANAYGALSMIKVDENDVNTVLQGAEFELYECETNDIEWQEWNTDFDVNLNTGQATFEKDGTTYYRVEGIDGKYYVGDKDGNKIPKPGSEGGKITGVKQIKTSSTTSDGIFRSDEDGIVNFGNNFNGEGHEASFKFNTLYYWVETKAPDQYYASLNVKHYFILYDESDEDTAYQNKRWAWDLDDNWQAANGIIVASLSNLSNWTATNSKTRSINVQKVWSGDFQNAYETRPASVSVTLMQKSVDGTAVAYQAAGITNPVNLSGDDSDYWPSVTWSKLPVADANGMPYTYYVVENPVPGYFTKYSDDQQGIETGKITVTNSLIPSTANVKVQKVWEDGESNERPSSVKVTLKQIPVDSEGVAGNPQIPIDPMKPIYAFTEESGKEYKNAAESGYTFAGYSDDNDQTPLYKPDNAEETDYNKKSIIGYRAIGDVEMTLVSGAEWSYEWESLPAKNTSGGTYLYTVVEDTTGKIYGGNTKSLEDLGYTVSYSDNGTGVIGDTIKVTNTKSAKMELKKTVTVNGKTGTRTDADGIYTFVIRTKDTDIAVKTVTITVENGQVTSSSEGPVKDGVVEIEGLAPGAYIVHENPSTNGTYLVGNNDVEVILTVGGTTVPTASFTNNIDTSSISIQKTWVNDTSKWPENVQSIEVTLKEPGTDGLQTAQRPADYPADEEWTPTAVLTADNPTHEWTGIDPDVIYTVEETKITYNDTEYAAGSAGVPYYSVSAPADSNGISKVVNYEITELPVEKVWNPASAEPGNWSLGVQLLKSERLIRQDGAAVTGTAAEWRDYTEVSDSDIPGNTSGSLITLYSDGTTEKSSAVFDHLPKYRIDGRKIYEIRYKVEEVGLTVDGEDEFVSSVVLTDSSDSTDTTPEHGYTITNTKSEKIPVTKSWPVVTYTDQNAGQQGQAGYVGNYVADDYDIMMDVASVEFAVMVSDGTNETPATKADGTPIEHIVIENPNKNLQNQPVTDWTGEFRNLPMLDSGYSYVVKEVKVTFTNGSVITDESTPSIETVFGGQTTVDGGSGAVTKTNTWPTTSVEVEKSWGAETEHTGYKVIATLYRVVNGKEIPVTEDINGDPIDNPIAISEAVIQDVPLPGTNDDTYTTKGGWADTFGMTGNTELLPKYETVNGTVREISYTVRETAVLDADNKDVTASFTTSAAESDDNGTKKVTFTNDKYVGDQVSITLNKKWVLNGKALDGTNADDAAVLQNLPAQTFKLYRTTTALPGSVASDTSEGATNVTYSVPELTQAEAEALGATREYVKDITLNEIGDGTWTIVITDLAKYADPSSIADVGNSVPYFYFVVEQGAEADTAYSAEGLASDNDGTWTVTNNKTEIRVKKKWIDSEGQELADWPKYDSNNDGTPDTDAEIGYLIYQDTYFDGNLVAKGTEPYDRSGSGTDDPAVLTKNASTSDKIELPNGGVYTATGSETGLEAGRNYNCTYKYRVVEALESDGAGTSVGNGNGAIGISAMNAEVDEEDSSLYVLTNKLTNVKVTKTWTEDPTDKTATVQLYRRTGDKNQVKYFDFTVTPSWVPEKPSGLTDETVTFKIAYWDSSSNSEVVVATETFGPSDDYAQKTIHVPATVNGVEVGYYIVNEAGVIGGEGGKIKSGARESGTTITYSDSSVRDLGYKIITTNRMTLHLEIQSNGVTGWNGNFSNEYVIIRYDNQNTKKWTSQTFDDSTTDLYASDLAITQDQFAEDGQSNYYHHTDWSTNPPTESIGSYEVIINLYNLGSATATVTSDVGSVVDMSSQYNAVYALYIPFDEAQPGEQKITLTITPTRTVPGMVLYYPHNFRSNLLTAVPGAALISGDRLGVGPLKVGALDKAALPAIGGLLGAPSDVTYTYVDHSDPSATVAQVESEAAIPADAVKVEGYSTTITGNGNFTWSNLPATDPDGNPYEYFVVETAATGATKVVATYTPENAQATDPDHDGTAEVSISNAPENEKTTGNLIVSKTVEGADGSSNTYHIQLKDANGNVMTLQNSSQEDLTVFDITSGQNVRFENLPTGSYTVVELDDDGTVIAGYVLSADSTTSVTGTVQKNEDTNLTGGDGLINKYVKDISFKKEWRNASNSTIAWPKESGADIPITVTVKQKAGEEGTAAEFAKFTVTSTTAELLETPALPDGVNLTAAVADGVWTVTGLPSKEGTGASAVEYIYTVEEAPVNGYTSLEPETQDGVTTFTNIAKTEYEAEKVWILGDEPDAETAVKTVELTLKRKLRVSGMSSLDYPDDETFNTDGSIKITLDGVADTEPDSTDLYGYEDAPWHVTWKNLDAVGEYNGANADAGTYRYTYYVEEKKFNYNNSEYTVADNGTTTLTGGGTGAFVVSVSSDGSTVTNEYNKKEFEVTKIWKNTNQTEKDWPGNGSEQITLVVQRNLVVRTPIYNEGTVIPDEDFNKGYTRGQSIITVQGPSNGTPYTTTAYIKVSESDGDDIAVPVTVSGDSSTGYRIAVTGLPKTGIIQNDGTTYFGEWEYTVTENKLNGYKDPVYSNPGSGNTALAENEGSVTNEEDSISVQAYKAWRDENGRLMLASDMPGGAKVVLRLFTMTESGGTVTYEHAKNISGVDVRDLWLNGRAETSDEMKAADGNSVDAFEVSPWRAQWNNLPALDGSGHAITYVIRELSKDGDPLETNGSNDPEATGNSTLDSYAGFMVDYNSTTTTDRTYTPAGGTVTNRQRTTELTVNKKWKNADDSTEAPVGAEVTFTVYKKYVSVDGAAVPADKPEWSEWRKAEVVSSTGATSNIMIKLNGKADVTEISDDPAVAAGQELLSDSGNSKDAYEKMAWTADVRNLPKYEYWTETIEDEQGGEPTKVNHYAEVTYALVEDEEGRWSNYVVNYMPQTTEYGDNLESITNKQEKGELTISKTVTLDNKTLNEVTGNDDFEQAASGKTYYVTIYATIDGEVKYIAKTGSNPDTYGLVDTEPIGNSRVSITTGAHSDTTDQDTTNDDETLDGKGSITITNIPVADYIVREDTTQATGQIGIDHYSFSAGSSETAGSVTFEKKDGSEDYEGTVALTNDYTKPKARVELNKVGDDGTPLGGAQFELKKLNQEGSEWVPDDSFTSVVVTSGPYTDSSGVTKEGYAKFDNVTAGRYSITEIVPPNGYQAVDGDIVFTLTETGNTGVLDLSFTDESRPIGVEYDSEHSGTNAYVYNVTNNELTEFEFTKEWLEPGGVGDPQPWPTYVDGNQQEVPLPITVTLAGSWTYTDEDTQQTVTVPVTPSPQTYTLYGNEPGANANPKLTAENNLYKYVISDLPALGTKTVGGKAYSGQITYTLTEAQPDGYNVPKYYSYDTAAETWSETGVDGDAAGACVSDKGKVQNVLTSVSIPHTGGPGIGTVYAVGAAMAVLAGALLFLRRRKSK